MTNDGVRFDDDGIGAVPVEGFSMDPCARSRLLTPPRESFVGTIIPLVDKVLIAESLTSAASSIFDSGHNIGEMTYLIFLFKNSFY